MDHALKSLMREPSKDKDGYVEYDEFGNAEYDAGIATLICKDGRFDRDVDRRWRPVGGHYRILTCRLVPRTAKPTSCGFSAKDTTSRFGRYSDQ